MTNAPSFTIRPYAPGDRDAVLALVPRLNVGRPSWRDPDRWESTFRRWVSAATEAAGATDGADRAGPADRKPAGDTEDHEKVEERIFVAVGPHGESGAESGTGAARETVVLGFVHVGPGAHFSGDPEAYIGELAVDRSHQRRGIGRALVEAARSWAARVGYDRIALHAAAGSPQALAFYRALGFEAESVLLSAPVGEA